MDTNTEKTTSKAQTRMAIYFRYPKTPHDEAIVQQRINALTSAISAGNDRTLTEVYTDIGTPVDKNDPFPGFERMRQDYMDGKFDVLLTEPPHGAYRGLDEGMSTCWPCAKSVSISSSPTVRPYPNFLLFLSSGPA